MGVSFAVQPAEQYREFWDWYETDAWEPETVAVFSRFLRSSTRYLDLGAWMGPTALLAAPFVERVVCLEPDPHAFASLTENLALNPATAAKTFAVQAAAGASDGTATLTSVGSGGDSNSSLVRRGDMGAHWLVEQVSISALLDRAGLDGVDFVKIDVEGAEYELVPAICSTVSPRPTLFVALHPNLLVDKRSAAARVVSSVLAMSANWRFLRALLAYRHHYVYDEQRMGFRDVRFRNLLRVLLPLPLRASFLIGACVFTDEHLPTTVIARRYPLTP